MPSFQPGERVRTTQAIQDVLPFADLPERVRDLPLVGEVVALEGPGTWRVRFDDLERDVEVADELLMPMDTNPALGPDTPTNG